MNKRRMNKKQVKQSISAKRYWSSLSPKDRAARNAKNNTKAANDKTKRFWKNPKTKQQRIARLAVLHKSRIGCKHSKETKKIQSNKRKLWWSRIPPKARHQSSIHIQRRSISLRARLAKMPEQKRRLYGQVGLVKACKSNNIYPERLLGRALRKLNIGFETQAPFDRYIVDIYIPSFKLAIECDGASHTKRKSRLNDKARDRRIHRMFGIKVLRFSYDEITKNVAVVTQKIIRFHRSLKNIS